jgi:arylsulfatase A-like enzyme
MKSLIASVVLCAFVSSLCVHAAANPKPNILFIYAEDIGYYSGERSAREPNAHIAGLRTPNLDALAASSVNFTRFFVGQSVCSPSKCAIYSGLLPHANGIWRNNHNAHPKLGGPEKWIPLPNPLTKENGPTFLAAGGMHEDTPNLIQRLKAGGVYCALSGKLHVQPARNFPYDAFVKDDDLESVIKAAGDKPWFFWCNPGDTHAPWWKHVQSKLVNPKDRNSAPKDVDPAARRVSILREHRCCFTSKAPASRRAASSARRFRRWISIPPSSKPSASRRSRTRTPSRSGPSSRGKWTRCPIAARS